MVVVAVVAVVARAGEKEVKKSRRRRFGLLSSELYGAGIKFSISDKPQNGRGGRRYVRTCRACTHAHGNLA